MTSAASSPTARLVVLVAEAARRENTPEVPTAFQQVLSYGRETCDVTLP